ncbi:hypothetical protein E2C01_038353 [Portunus trituberculatus]|uniref:Uncharacterized protein n=1 Tax=Portunus trituberculatus TaxID=210409 RepID=A0A5B7FGK1_PORTR|nr:hypothetical protein [Portunus trituberculatus]
MISQGHLYTCPQRRPAHSCRIINAASQLGLSLRREVHVEPSGPIRLSDTPFSNIHHTDCTPMSTSN